jgi:toxin CcdB
MAQFTVYKNKNAQSKKEFPLLLDVQSDLLESLQTTVVMPLKTLATNKNIAFIQLTPTLTIGDTTYLMMMPNWRELSVWS